MDGAKRSRTAQGVAAERALLTGMGVLDDPLARHMLTPIMGAILRVVEQGPQWLLRRSVTLAGLAARVRWFDAQVIRARDAGIRQVAVIGAGYDSRAWRIGGDGVQFFELDHAATQRDKRGRVSEVGPVYVESDLTTENAARCLLDHGLDASRPALFVVEGVTMYLDEGDVRSQLEFLAGLTAIGSRLAVDFYPPGTAGTSQDHRQLRLQRLARRGSGESLRLALDRPRAVELVQASGWAIVEAASLREVARALVPVASGLPIAAINEHKTVIAAARMP
jgi:methyltransferase (TIGR00027 family)